MKIFISKNDVKWGIERCNSPRLTQKVRKKSKSFMFVKFPLQWKTFPCLGLVV